MTTFDQSYRKALAATAATATPLRLDPVQSNQDFSEVRVHVEGTTHEYLFRLANKKVHLMFSWPLKASVNLVGEYRRARAAATKALRAHRAKAQS